MVVDRENPPGERDAWRCDTCSRRHAESPIRWTYRTKSSVSQVEYDHLKEHMKKHPKIRGIDLVPTSIGELPGVAFEDEQWAVCQPCHELIQDGDLESLITRNFEAQYVDIMVVGDSDGRVAQMIEMAKVESASVIAAFWFHRDGYPERFEEQEVRSG
jgi:hypothetical protein